MVCSWPRLSLREAGVRLLDCEHRTPLPASDGYPYIAIPQIRDGRLNLCDARRISSDDFFDWTRKTRPQRSDVIVVRRCNPGDTAAVPDGLECALGQNLVLLRADGTRVVPEFLRWLARGPAWWEQIQKFLNVGAVFDSLRCQDIPNFELPVPPLAEQREIASILGALDDKIELNRRMNETLEGIARALFKSWFVDFDPVRAKAAGRKPAGLDAETARLFPDQFASSDIGMVPDGWRVEPLGSALSLARGAAYKSSELAPSTTALVTLKSFDRGGGYREDGLKPYVGAFRPEQVLQGGDCVVALTDVTQAGDVIGKPALVRSAARFATLVASQDVGIVRATNATPSSVFIYLLCLTNEFQDHVRGYANGSTVLHLQKGAVEAFRVGIPAPGVLARFDGVAVPLFERVDANVSESGTLAALRDALLPKLLSGELRVRDAERLAEVRA